LQKEKRDPPIGGEHASVGSGEEEQQQMSEFDKREMDLKAEFEAALKLPNVGEIVTGTVVRVADDHILVDIGHKSEGYISLRDLTHRRIEKAADAGFAVGDSIKVKVLSLGGKDDGYLRLSKRAADEGEVWQKIVALHESGEIVEAPVTEAVKGGLVLDLGIRAFMPASQVDRGYVADLNKYVGQTLRVKVIELEERKKRVIVSRKVVIEQERNAAKEAFWANIEEGQILKGTVKSLTEFGAFVDLGGVDGLLHVSEMSFGRIKHPSEAVAVGQELEVKVLRLDREKEKISLSLKQVLPDPWANVAEKYTEGLIVEGTVARLATFGAFVELEPAVDGLVHVSQLADRRVQNPNEVVEVGQKVKVKVIGVDPEAKRISLSLKDVDAEATEESAE
jgi:ribosomal protein S1